MASAEELLIRANNDSFAQIIKGHIYAACFAEYGIVDSVVDSTHVNVRNWFLASSKERFVRENIELIRLGSASCKIEIAPKKGDVVLLIGSKRYVDELVEDDPLVRSDNGLAYVADNYKALQLYTKTDKDPLCTVSLDADADTPISISAKGATAISVDGKVSLDATDSVTINNHLEIKA